MTMVLKWNGERAKAAARRGGLSGLKRWADDVFDASQEEVPVAPVRGGFLRDSGQVSVDEGVGRAAVSYSGPPARSDGRFGGADIAAIVHEDMGAQHSTGKAKYLEDPLNATKTSGPQTVAREIKAALG
jgi:hypothetical protein